MIKWYQGLYMDDKTSKNPGKCMERVEAAKLWKRSYTVIALPSNSENLFDIYNSRELFFEYYKRKNMYILGVASDRESAFDLLTFIIDDIIQQTGEFNPREFFSQDRFVDRQ